MLFKFSSINYVFQSKLQKIVNIDCAYTHNKQK